MHLLLHLITVIILAFISYQHEAIAQFIPPNFTSIVFPVTKHTDSSVKSLYSVQMITSVLRTNFVIDIDAPLIWHDCIVQNPDTTCPTNTLCTSPVSCEDYECTDVRTNFSYHNPSCPPVTNGSTLPGLGHCICPVNVMDMNPYTTGSCTQAVLNSDVFTGNTSNGRNIFSSLFSTFPTAACVPSSTTGSLPWKVSGVMAFSKSPYALPAYLRESAKKTLAICLPTEEYRPGDDLYRPGVLFLGAGPYYLLPNSDVDVRSFLTHTPLLNHPNSSGYFIGVNSIRLGLQTINIPGPFTTKLSTIEPYTILRTDVYKRLIQAFKIATLGIPPAIKLIGIFDLCYQNINWSGPKVLDTYKFPDIHFNLEDGKKWTIHPANSMKTWTNFACLAFFDGGPTAEHAVVIGTHQFEDNFLEFDLENSSFGFSSALSKKKTSCANFNFTVTDGK